MNKPKVIFYDFETTGLNVYHDEPIELAAMDQDGNIYNELFKPYRGEISLYITKLTGITNAMVQDKPSFKDSYKGFLDFVGYEDRPIYFVAHNQEFDMMYLKKYLRNNFNPNWRFIDSIHLAKLVWPHKNSYKLGNLARSAEIEFATQHRALEDVKILAELFNILNARFDSSSSNYENIETLWKYLTFQ